MCRVVPFCFVTITAERAALGHMTKLTLTGLYTLNAFLTFITQLDKQAVRAVLVLLVMIFMVVTLIGYGRVYLDFGEPELLAWFELTRGTVWAFPMVVATFTLLAFVGVPQWALIAGSVVAFGPSYGAAYAWGATMVSASVNFWVARSLGADRLQRFGGAFINRMVGLVRRNGFFTSFTVRLVPTGPFILVNMAAGVSKMQFPAFLAGTGLGILPKILAVAFVGQGMAEAIKGQSEVFLWFSIGLALVTVIIMLVARARLKKRLPPELTE